MSQGPVVIFDKSALQALTLDEANWLDNFFLSNITQFRAPPKAEV